MWFWGHNKCNCVEIYHLNQAQLKAEWLVAEIIILGIIEHIEKVQGKGSSIYLCKIYILIISVLSYLYI